MTDLTEQLKKGELLPDDLYWVKHDGVINILDNLEISLTDVEQVLAPVPSYDEWQASENYIDYLKQCISVYESKDKQATETSIAYNELLEENAQLKSKLQLKETAYDFDTARLEEENARLKELLKECRKSFNKLKGDTVWYPYEVDECITKIDEALR